MQFTAKADGRYLITAGDGRAASSLTKAEITIWVMEEKRAGSATSNGGSAGEQKGGIRAEQSGAILVLAPFTPAEAC